MCWWCTAWCMVAWNTSGNISKTQDDAEKRVSDNGFGFFGKNSTNGPDFDCQNPELCDTIGEAKMIRQNQTSDGEKRMRSKRDITLDDVVRIATAYFGRRERDADRGAEMGQEAAIFAWQRLPGYVRKGKTQPIRYALWAGIRDVIMGRHPSLKSARDRDAKKADWEYRLEPRSRLNGVTPLSSDDYAERRGLVNAQEYRIALATDDASTIDALYADA